MLNQGDRVLKLYNRQYPFTKSLEFIWKVQIEVNFPSITIHFLKGQNKWQGSRDIFSWKGEQKFRHKMIKPLVWDDQTFRQPKWLSYHSSHSLLVIILLQTTISKNNQQKKSKNQKIITTIKTKEFNQTSSLPSSSPSSSSLTSDIDFSDSTSSSAAFAPSACSNRQTTKQITHTVHKLTKE